MVKNLPAMQETWIQSRVGKVPWRRERQPTPVFLPEESYGQKSLMGYSPWGHKESDRTEQMSIYTRCTLSSFSFRKEILSSPRNWSQDPIQAWHQAKTQHLRVWFMSLFARGLCVVLTTLSVCLVPLDLKTNGLKGYLQTSQPIFSGRTGSE